MCFPHAGPLSASLADVLTKHPPIRGARASPRAAAQAGPPASTPSTCVPGRLASGLNPSPRGSAACGGGSVTLERFTGFRLESPCFLPVSPLPAFLNLRFPCAKNGNGIHDRVGARGSWPACLSVLPCLSISLWSPEQVILSSSFEFGYGHLSGWLWNAVWATQGPGLSSHLLGPHAGSYPGPRTPDPKAAAFLSPQARWIGTVGPPAWKHE